MVLELGSDAISTLVFIGVSEVHASSSHWYCPDHSHCNRRGTPILNPKELVWLVCTPLHCGVVELTEQLALATRLRIELVKI